MKLREKIFIILCFISFIQPNFFVKIPALNTVSIIGAVFCLFVLLLKILKKSLKIDKTFILLVLWRIMILFPTLKNNGEIIKWGYQSVVFFGLYLLIINYINNKKAFKIIYKMTLLYILMNIGLIFVFPNGIFPEYGIYFLGIRTRFTEYSIALIYLSIIYFNEFSKKQKKNKFFMIFSIFIAIINVVIKWVATGVVALSLFLLFYFIFRKKKKIKNFYKFGFISLIIFTILLINGNILNFFNDIFVFLNKDITLTGRTLIWKNAIPLLKEYFWFGFGYINDGNIINYYGGLWQAHNTLIQSICECGIFGTGAFFLMLYEQGKPTNIDGKYRSKILNISIIFTYLVMMMTEIIYYYPIFIFIILLIGNMKKKGGEKRDNF